LSAPLLSVQGVVKDFGYRRVLKEVSFDLHGGDFTLLLGQNGAGKSTLLKILCGLMRPTSGQVLFEGRSVSENPDALRQALGQVSHQPQVYGDLSAKENLRFFASLRNIEDGAAKVDKALAQVGLEKVANAQAKNFSSGMFKRLGIAKLMLAKPRLLLLDEPYTGLDYKSVGFFNQFLGQFVQEGGAVLMITHQLDCCFELASKVAILEQGKIDSEHGRAQFNYETLIEHYQRATQ